SPLILFNFSTSSLPNLTSTTPPAYFCSAGLSRSVPNVSNTGPPTNSFLQYSPCSSITPPPRHLLCHPPSSAYSTRNSSRGSSSPPLYAPYSTPNSCINTPIDHPSLTMWCIVTSSTCSSSPNRNNLPLTSGPLSKSNRPLTSSSACLPSSLSSSSPPTPL